jgi:UDP-GlcNAc3NAcA epimerase
MLFSPTKAGIMNLENEGFRIKLNSPYTIHNPGVFHCGDIMYDNSLFYSTAMTGDNSVDYASIIPSTEFVLVTIHRPSNTDTLENLSAICHSLLDLSQILNVSFVIPLHPRTKKILEESDLLALLVANNKMIIIPPASFLQMIALEKRCCCVITDSGGVQKEAFFFKKPCVIVRDETEWVEIVDAGCAVLSKPQSIAEKTIQILQSPPQNYPLLFGDGKAAEFICEKIIQNTISVL